MSFRSIRISKGFSYPIRADIENRRFSLTISPSEARRLLEEVNSVATPSSALERLEMSLLAALKTFEAE